MKSFKKQLMNIGATNIKYVELLEGAFYRYELNGHPHVTRIQTLKQMTINEKKYIADKIKREQIKWETKWEKSI